jgi:hypothetical protein
LLVLDGQDPSPRYAGTALAVAYLALPIISLHYPKRLQVKVKTNGQEILL